MNVPSLKFTSNHLLIEKVTLLENQKNVSKESKNIVFNKKEIGEVLLISLILLAFYSLVNTVIV